MFEISLKIGRRDTQTEGIEGSQQIQPEPPQQPVETSHEEEIKPYSLSVLLQASSIVGNRIFNIPDLVSNEVLEQAVLILSTEKRYGRVHRKTPEYEERLNVLNGHFNRCDQLHQEEIARDFSDEAILKAEHNKNSFYYALRPNEALGILLAEQQVRSGELNISLLQPLDSLGSISPISLADLEKLYETE